MVEDSTTSPELSSPLLRRLLNEHGSGRTYSARLRFPLDPSEPPKPPRVLESLGLSEEDLSDVAKEALEAIREIAGNSETPAWEEFRWRLAAFQCVQDIFDVPLERASDPKLLFQQYYFYYESRILLAESFLSGLSGLYVAADALLRPFLEFSLLQNYFYRNVEKQGSYAALETYFRKRTPPSWNTVVRGALPPDGFCKPIKFRVQKMLSGLSQTTAHSYHPEFSAVQHRSTPFGHSLEGLFFWTTTRMVLDAVLSVYYVNFPLLLHPVDVLKKFGFARPVGVVVDPPTSTVVRQSLTPEDGRAFLDYTGNRQETRDILADIAARPDLSEDEIRATWNPEDGALEDIRLGHAKALARFRALRAAMAFRGREVEPPSQAVAERMLSLAGWRELSRRKPRPTSQSKGRNG